MNFAKFKEIMSSNGFVKLVDIAKELNVTPQAINNWKLRDQVPYKISLLITQKYADMQKDDYQKNSSNSKPNKNYTSKNIYLEKANYDNATLITKENEISLFEVILILKDHVRIMVKAAIFCFLSAFIYVFIIAEEVFVSSATIIPANNENESPQITGLASQFGISLPGKSSGPSQIYPQIIESRTLAKKMLYKTFFSKKFGKEKTLLDLLTQGYRKSGKESDVIEKFGLIEFSKKLFVDEDINTSIVTISVESFEPKLASDIANSLIDEFDIHQKQFNTKQAEKKRIFIEERINEVSIDLRSAEEDLKEFRLKNKKYQDSPNLLLEFERLLREVEVQKQIYITLKEEFERAKIQEVEDGDIIYVIDRPEIPLESTKPKKALIIVLATSFGLGAAGAYVLSKNWYHSFLKQ